MEPRDPLTFFFSDIEGSTRAAGTLGPGFAAALEAHRRAIRTAFERHGGTEVSTAGDSFFAVFPTADAALAAAVDIQRCVDASPGSPALWSRIGLHTGQAMRVGRDYVGLEVHRAARIADAGHGGQILVSAATHALIEGVLPTGLEVLDLGRHRLKDIGPERLWQVSGNGLPSGPFPALRSLEAHPTNLPVETTPLIDRERETRDLRSLVRASPVVVVTGPGGIGKSRLALAVAWSLVPDLADGVFHLDLAALPDASHVAAALIEVLGAAQATDDAMPVLLDRLRNQDVLVVLDTGDRVLGLGGLVAAIAAACPRVRVLVTSRSPLHVAAEREYPLASLPTSAAVDLFAERVRAIRPAFELDAGTRGTVRRLVDRLDGIPLAIELAAARTRLLAPAVLLDRLERRLPALGEGSRDAPDRQRTLAATIAWSCELLARDERTTFEQLGVLEGDFDLAAVEGVAEPGGDRDVATILETLVDRSLVATDVGSGAEPRFRLLRPVHDFALEALRTTGDEVAVLERHAAYWTAAIRRAAGALERETGLEAIARIQRDEPNIHKALAWSLEHAPERGAELVASLARYWRLRGRVAEGLDWLTRAAAVSTSAPAPLRAEVMFWKGALEDDARRPAEAARSLEEALTLRRQLGDDKGVGRALNSLGIVIRSNGDLDAAERMLHESIAVAERIGDRRGVAMALSNLGIVAEDRDRHAQAAEYVARALDIDRELGGAYVIVGTLNLAVTLIRAGSVPDGVARLREALPGIRELDDPDLVLEALAALAEAAMAHADLPLSARLALAAQALADLEVRPLHPSDRRRLDAVVTAAAPALPATDLAQLRAEAGVVDRNGGLALVAEAVASLGGRAVGGRPELG